MRSLFILAAAAVAAVLCLGAVPAVALTSAGPSAAKAAASDVIPVGNSHRRPYYRVHVPRYPQQGWVPPYLRGFKDPGYAYHGNINGCVVDLGYGRWESCNVGR